MRISRRIEGLCAKIEGGGSEAGVEWDFGGVNWGVWWVGPRVWWARWEWALNRVAIESLRLDTVGRIT